VLGGGSSINVMGWARGHKNDWDFFASESGERAWNYESVLNIYRRIEDWQGAPDAEQSSKPCRARYQVRVTNEKLTPSWRVGIHPNTVDSWIIGLDHRATWRSMSMFYTAVSARL